MINDEEPQYDYAYENSEILTDNEKKEKLLKGMGGLLKHVAFKFTEAGLKAGESAPVPKFNDTLSVPNLLSRGHPLLNGRRLRKSI